jgi:hypothetical protein
VVKCDVCVPTGTRAQKDRLVDLQERMSFFSMRLSLQPQKCRRRELCSFRHHSQFRRRRCGRLPRLATCAVHTRSISNHRREFARRGTDQSDLNGCLRPLSVDDAVTIRDSFRPVMEDILIRYFWSFQIAIPNRRLYRRSRQRESSRRGFWISKECSSGGGGYTR